MNPPASRPLAVVTGASSGIGQQLAVQFAGAGFDLVVAAEEVRITDTASSLRAQQDPASRVQVTAVQVDLASYDGVEALSRAVQATGRTPDAVAINAGVGQGEEKCRSATSWPPRPSVRRN
jgi:NAD(P)-dependent dehydrogenase (short-subunit alcohol dehydrogenase family)